LSVERSTLSVERSAPLIAVTDADNPWPGLSSFTEETRGFFYGRDTETDELSRLVRRETLTVLFGQSGLGKSSLLQAALFPLLREIDHLPLYLRLDHAADAPALAEQVKVALHAAFAEAKADAPAGARKTNSSRRCSRSINSRKFSRLVAPTRRGASVRAPFSPSWPIWWKTARRPRCATNSIAAKPIPRATISTSLRVA
jgi:hypothetical protein